jgi:hypothetical protein
MKIDKPGRKIIAVKIDNVLLAPIGSLTKIDNFSILHHDVDPVADSVWHNAARICEDHSIRNTIAFATGKVHSVCWQ